MEKKIFYALSFLAGILYSLGFPSFLSESLLVTPIIAMAILWYNFFSSGRTLEIFYHILSFTVSFTLASFYWIAQTLSEFGGLPLWLGIILNTLFAFIMIPWLWIVLFLFWLAKKKKVSFERFIHSRLFVPVMAITLTALEYFVPQQFPTHIGGPWVAISQYLTLADIGGLPLYSFLSFLLVFTLVQKLKTKKLFYAPLITTSLVIAAHFFYSVPIQEIENKINARLVQANISNYLKVSSETGERASVSQVLERYQELSLAPSEKDLDLIVWPETAYPYALNSFSFKETGSGHIPQMFQEIMYRQNAHLFVGGYDQRDDQFQYYESEYNSGFLFNENFFKGVYHKRVLIPFGETLPFGPLTEFVSQFFGNIAFFARGEDFPILSMGQRAKFIGAICYEILKPTYIRDYLNALKERPHFIINITNDSWYGDTLEPHQHLFLTRWRAIEFRLPILRSTNTGISAFIDIHGEVKHKLGVFQTGNLDFEFNSELRPRTIFERFGFAAIVPLFILLFIFELTMLKLKNEK